MAVEATRPAKWYHPIKISPISHTPVFIFSIIYTIFAIFFSVLVCLWACVCVCVSLEIWVTFQMIIFSPMTHTFPLLDYANATFEPAAVNERETADPVLVNRWCMTQNADDKSHVQSEHGAVTMFSQFCIWKLGEIYIKWELRIGTSHYFLTVFQWRDSIFSNYWF